MDYLSVVVLIVPAVIGLLAAVALGPNRGVVAGAVATFVGVLLLLLSRSLRRRSRARGG